jgi:hypothetical protein
MKRHKDALAIQQQGACNPSGIAVSIVDACRAVHQERGSPASDPAVRLMVHQLAFVCGVTSGFEPMARGENYESCIKACEASKEAA